MEFHARFVCSKCSADFTIDLGPEKLAELRTPRKIGEAICAFAALMARSCLECEKSHVEEAPRPRQPTPSDAGERGGGYESADPRFDDGSGLGPGEGRD